MNVEDSGSASATFFESTFIILFTSSPCFIRSALGGILTNSAPEFDARVRVAPFSPTTHINSLIPSVPARIFCIFFITSSVRSNA